MNGDAGSEQSLEDLLAGNPAATSPTGAAVVPPAPADGDLCARIVANIRAELTRQMRSASTRCCLPG